MKGRVKRGEDGGRSEEGLRESEGREGWRERGKGGEDGGESEGREG